MKFDPQMNYFLDTTILVYAYDSSAGRKHDIVAKFVEDCWKNENGCLSIQVLQEFFVTVTRKIAAPLNPLTARQIVADLAEWRLQSPEVNDVLQAIDFLERYQLSFWDAMIVQSAVRMGCKQLLSEDLSHSRMYGSVEVINPFEKVG